MPIDETQSTWHPSYGRMCWQVSCECLSVMRRRPTLAGGEGCSDVSISQNSSECHFCFFFSLDWGEESRGDQRTDQWNSSADTADTAVSASWLKAMMLFFFFTTPDDLKQSIKYKKVPYENLRMITKGSPGPPKGKNSRYPLQLWDFFSLSPNSIQSETLKLLLFKSGPSCWAPLFRSGPSRPGALNASFN